MQYLGETFLFPVVDGRSLASPSTNLQSFYPCNGATLSVNASAGDAGDACDVPSPNRPTNLALANLLGTNTSGNDVTFTLPNLTPPAPGVKWFISNTGPVASGRAVDDAMPFVGQISVHPVDPKRRQYDVAETMPCDGRMLSPLGYPSLFALLGSAFGGDGQRSFAMPNLPAPGPSLFFSMCTSGPVPPLVPFPQEVPG